LCLTQYNQNIAFYDRILWIRAFSSEVGTGSREENATKQKDRAADLIQSDRPLYAPTTPPPLGELFVQLGLKHADIA
jgi:hypothetical protein